MGVLCAAEVRRHVDRLQSYRSLDEIQRLAEAGDHAGVVDLLLPSFPPPPASSAPGGEGFVGGAVGAGPQTSAAERQAQMILLMDSLIVLESYRVICMAITLIMISLPLSPF